MPVSRDFENKILLEGYSLIAGVDEAGRGPLAGPVVAAAVILPLDAVFHGLDDSKKVSASVREKLFIEITEKALSVEYTVLSNRIIDKLNILNASLRAMKLSVEKLKIKPDLVLIDGNKTFESYIETRAIIKGDGLSYSIAAASIIAKVTRDRIMMKQHRKYPVYHWDTNKGYPTKEHREAIAMHGITPLHRRTFLRKFDQYELFGKQ